MSAARVVVVPGLEVWESASLTCSADRRSRSGRSLRRRRVISLAHRRADADPADIRACVTAHAVAGRTRARCLGHANADSHELTRPDSAHHCAVDPHAYVRRPRDANSDTDAHPNRASHTLCDSHPGIAADSHTDTLRDTHQSNTGVAHSDTVLDAHAGLSRHTHADTIRYANTGDSGVADADALRHCDARGAPDGYADIHRFDGNPRGAPDGHTSYPAHSHTHAGELAGVVLPETQADS